MLLLFAAAAIRVSHAISEINPALLEIPAGGLAVEAEAGDDDHKHDRCDAQEHHHGLQDVISSV